MNIHNNEWLGRKYHFPDLIKTSPPAQDHTPFQNRKHDIQIKSDEKATNLLFSLEGIHSIYKKVWVGELSKIYTQAGGEESARPMWGGLKIESTDYDRESKGRREGEVWSVAILTTPSPTFLLTFSFWRVLS